MSSLIWRTIYGTFLYLLLPNRSTPGCLSTCCSRYPTVSKRTNILTRLIRTPEGREKWSEVDPFSCNSVPSSARSSVTMPLSTTSASNSRVTSLKIVETLIHLLKQMYSSEISISLSLAIPDKHSLLPKPLMFLLIRQFEVTIVTCNDVRIFSKPVSDHTFGS